MEPPVDTSDTAPQPNTAALRWKLLVDLRDNGVLELVQRGQMQLYNLSSHVHGQRMLLRKGHGTAGKCFWAALGNCVQAAYSFHKNACRRPCTLYVWSKTMLSVACRSCASLPWSRKCQSPPSMGIFSPLRVAVLAVLAVRTALSFLLCFLAPPELRPPDRFIKVVVRVRVMVGGAPPPLPPTPHGLRGDGHMAIPDGSHCHLAARYWRAANDQLL